MARLRKCALALVVALAAVTGPGALAAGPPARRVGSAPALPPGASIAGAVSGSTPMQLAVALQPRDPAALEAFANAVSTPGSSLYGHYITPAQFAEQFGPTSAKIDAVESSLRAHGLEPGQPSANHLSLPVTASAAGIERAFSVGLERVSLPNQARGIVNTVAPQLDGSIAGLVQGVVGLSSLATPHPLYVRPHGARSHSTRHVATGGPQPCPAARAAAPGQSAYTADQIASAYGFSGLYGAGDQGKGQTVALYELEPYAAADIAAYQSCYGTHASVSSVAVDGGAGGGPGQGEAALDIEQVIGLTPQATILVYEGPNSTSSAPGSGYYDTWNTLIAQDRARVVSASWGQCEALVPPSDAQAEGTLFEEAAAQGQTIFSAGGDQGSEDCNGQTGPLPDTRLAVDDPSSQPFVSGVGGTTLSALGPRPTEKVWNSGGGLGGLLGAAPGAGGGGKSSLWAMPSYQSGAPSFLHVAQSSSRETPDVSADADPNTGYLIYWNGNGSALGPAGWQGIGGRHLGGRAAVGRRDVPHQPGLPEEGPEADRLRKPGALQGRRGRLRPGLQRHQEREQRLHRHKWRQVPRRLRLRPGLRARDAERLRADRHAVPQRPPDRSAEGLGPLPFGSGQQPSDPAADGRRRQGRPRHSQRVDPAAELPALRT